MRSQRPDPESFGTARENMTASMRASVERGLADSAAGRTVDLGDFTQYAEPRWRKLAREVWRALSWRA